MPNWHSDCSTSGARRPAATSCRCTCTGSSRSRARFATTAGFRVRSIGQPDDDEGRLIQAFFATVERYTPQLVSWNGGGFDLPVLHYRGLIHGVHAARYWELGDDDRDFRYNNYIGRYHTRHIDLMDLLAMYQPRASAPLDDLAKLCGFAGKLGMDGSRVWEAFQAGGIEQIRELLRDRRRQHLPAVHALPAHARSPGRSGRLRRRERRVHAALAALPQPHWQEYLAAWGRPEMTSAKCSRSRSSRSTRTAAASAIARARRCSSKARCQANRVRYERRRNKASYEIGRVVAIERDVGAAYHAALSSLRPGRRFVRRLFDAAPRRTRAGGDQAACARGQPVAYRTHTSRAHAATDRRTRPGATAIGPD